MCLNNSNGVHVYAFTHCPSVVVYHWHANSSWVVCQKLIWGVCSRFQQIGNAVSPPTATALGRCLLLAATAQVPHGQPLVSVPDPDLMSAYEEAARQGLLHFMLQPRVQQLLPQWQHTRRKVVAGDMKVPAGKAVVAAANAAAKPWTLDSVLQGALCQTTATTLVATAQPAAGQMLRWTSTTTTDCQQQHQRHQQQQEDENGNEHQTQQQQQQQQEGGCPPHDGPPSSKRCKHHAAAQRDMPAADTVVHVVQAAAGSHDHHQWINGAALVADVDCDGDGGVDDRMQCDVGHVHGRHRGPPTIQHPLHSENTTNYTQNTYTTMSTLGQQNLPVQGVGRATATMQVIPVAQRLVIRKCMPEPVN